MSNELPGWLRIRATQNMDVVREQVRREYVSPALSVEQAEMLIDLFIGTAVIDKLRSLGKLPNDE